MAPDYSIAGGHARGRVRSYARRGLLGLSCLVVCTVIAGMALGFTSLSFAAVEVVAIAAMLSADRFFSPVIDRWDQGAVGEETVGEALAPLEGAGWRVLHDVMIGSRGNIDHVVVGRAGLFTVETKSHGGRIRAASVDTRMLNQAYAEAKSIERVTGEKVTPLLVFSRAFLQPAISHRRGVTVLPARMLAGYLERRPPVLEPERVEALHARLRATIATDGG
jgi:hypothetical protein